MNRLTTYQNGKFMSGAIKENGPSAPIVIGSDVWIGHGAILMKGIKVGNGAIIGGGSVVTHDIPDFGIVAGNPARLLKMRFDENIIEAMKELAWWNYDEISLKLITNVFKMDLSINSDQVISALEEAKKNLLNHKQMDS